MEISSNVVYGDLIRRRFPDEQFAALGYLFELHAGDDLSDHLSATQFQPLLLRAIESLNTADRMLAYDPQLRVLAVRSRTLAKVDSIRLLERMWCQCWAGQS